MEEVSDNPNHCDLGKLSKGLREDLGVDYSKSGMRAKAHSMGWSYKKPQPVFHNKAGIEDILPWCHCAAEWFDELEKDRFDACVADQHRVDDYNPTGRLICDSTLTAGGIYDCRPEAVQEHWQVHRMSSLS